MAYNYDALYRTTKDALGAPTKKIVDAFAALDGRRLRVLDVGCGQGRDALFIARLGHHVTGVDISTSGISAMIVAAKAEGLSVEGVVADDRLDIDQRVAEGKNIVRHGNGLRKGEDTDGESIVFRNVG